VESGQPTPEITEDIPDGERTPYPPPGTLRRDFSAGLTELDGGEPVPSPPAWKRDESAGLLNLRPPSF
jgi:hypothetical protein